MRNVLTLVGYSVTAIGGVIGLAALIAFGIILGVAGGAFTGYVVNMFWPNTFHQLLVHFNLGEFELWQIGAGLGFVGGFVRSSHTTKESKKKTEE